MSDQNGMEILSRRTAAILIVDDAPANLGALREVLQQQGYQVYVANAGERALKIARRVHPDLILLDVMMPGMDGFETCRQLKATPATARIPVIFMSARSETDDVVEGLDLGAVDYIGKPLRMAEVCARVRTQLQLRASTETDEEQAERLHTIVNSMAEGLMIIDATGRIQTANPACAHYLGYAENELDGHDIGELFSGPLVQECLDFFGDYCDHPDSAHHHGAREVMVRRRDGLQRPMDLSLTPMFVREPLFIGLLHDIAHHKLSERELARDALIDPLTQIANRRQFDACMEKEWLRAVRGGTPLALAVIDVDHFKLYNDSLGHVAGDGALNKVAQAIASHGARPGDLAARYGGEEFVLLFPETTLSAAGMLAEEIRLHVHSLSLAHPRSPTAKILTVSIGVACCRPQVGDELETLFMAADRAMYRAKESGRNQVVSVLPEDVLTAVPDIQ
jgi:two-component system cell cycle response regulator